jgi:glucosylceramidase
VTTLLEGRVALAQLPKPQPLHDPGIIFVTSDPRSTWAWAQNSLVTVDTEAKTYRFNPDYYVLKHLSHFVNVGATRINATGTCDDALAFQNPDGRIAVILRNELPHPQLVQIDSPGRTVVVELPPDSLGTLSIGSDKG